MFNQGKVLVLPMCKEGQVVNSLREFPDKVKITWEAHLYHAHNLYNCVAE